MKRFTVGGSFVWITLTAVACGQTPYPMLMSTKPVAVPVGQISEVEVSARYNLFGASRALISGQGVTGEVISPVVESGKKPPTLSKIKVRLNVAPDAEPGVRDFRLLTPQGASTLAQLVLVRDPVVSEKENNNTAKDAQLVPLPATVCGALARAEDVDYYRFQVDAATHLTFHVRAMRLQDKIHDLQRHVDPIITLRSASGSILASCDNYFSADPFLSYQFEESDEYLLEIRDVRYNGNQYWEYSVEISHRPFVTNVHPLGVNAGRQTELTMVGFHLPDPPVAVLDIPSSTRAGPALWRLPLQKGSSDPVPVIVAERPVLIESDGANDSADLAQPIPVPADVSGRIEVEGDVDCYRFDAKKGQRFSFEVMARRHGSQLDSHLRILNPSGKQLASNDDLRLGKRLFADSWIENWTAPADGPTVVEIRDVHLRGGPGYTYHLTMHEAEPYFELYLDTDKTQLTPGTCGVIFARVVRKNGFKGEIELAVDGLPDGVTPSCGRILDTGQDGVIILAAAADAKPIASNVTVTGTAHQSAEDGARRTISAVATPYQETYLPGGGRGHWPCEMHTVAVGAPSDIRGVALSTSELTLRPGESQKVSVKIERAPSFGKNVTLDMLFQHLGGVHGNSLPKGVTIDAKSSKTLLTGDATEGHFTLTAAADAPAVAKQQVPVMANVSINFVMKATYSSPPLLVSVDR